MNPVRREKTLEELQTDLFINLFKADAILERLKLQNHVRFDEQLMELNYLMAAIIPESKE